MAGTATSTAYASGVELDGIFLARPERVEPGIPLAVKDLLDTEGLTTTYGSAIFAEHVPARTAESVRRLEATGYATVGKTNLHEFAYGVTSENPHFGTVPNPAAPGRIAGGSSGGSAAALAAGLADVALGTDSGGSIRIPAACCGVVGFKPTFDLVSADGCFPLASSFDHVGPLARDVATCEAALAALAPGYERAAASARLRVAVAWTEQAEPLVRRRVEHAARELDAQPLDFPRESDTYALFMREVADVHRELYAEHEDLYGDDVAAKIERCLAVTAAEVEAARRNRDAYREAAAAALDGFDLLLTPTLASVAPPVGIGDAKLRERLIRFTYPFNALGWPALALPCGPAEEGLPASLQLVGRAGDDALVLAAGAELERRLASHSIAARTASS
jgi:aspartyl-tRNA(Asn)/glutamyl-tRNA(Gln) amidotransferase subunit A